MSLFAGFEYEFFVFDETPDSVRAKHYRDLKPIAPDFFGYSVIRNSVWSDLYRDLLDSCEKMDLPIEGLHEETGPGVMEAALAVDEGARRGRQGGAVQDLRQDHRAAPRADGDLHGQVVEGLAGPERPHPHVAARCGRQAGVPRRHAGRTA